MGCLKISIIITAVFMATVGYGQQAYSAGVFGSTKNVFESGIKQYTQSIGVTNAYVHGWGNSPQVFYYHFVDGLVAGNYNIVVTVPRSNFKQFDFTVNGERVWSDPQNKGEPYTIEGIEIEIYHDKSGFRKKLQFSINGKWDDSNVNPYSALAFTDADIEKFRRKPNPQALYSGQTIEEAIGEFRVRMIDNGRLTASSVPIEKIKRIIKETQEYKPPQEAKIVFDNNSSSGSTSSSGSNSSSSGSSNSSSNNTTNSNTSSSNKKTSDDKTETNTNSNVPKATYTDPRTGTELTYEQLEFQRRQYQQREREKIANAVNPVGQIMKESGLNDYFQREMDRIDREYEEKSAALDRELARQKREKEAKALQEKQEWEAIMAKREKYESITKNVYEIYNRYPSGELPTSATKVNTNKLYYFIYAGTIGSYTGNEIFNGEAIEYVSNVFAIGQYPDGTWPMKTTIESEVRTLTNGRGVIHGYFTSEKEAQIALNRFKSEIINAGMKINNITYEGKNAKIQQNQTDNSQQALDYWGNPIKKTNTSQSKQTTTQPKQQHTNKPKLDYWGNPIKE